MESGADYQQYYVFQRRLAKRIFNGSVAVAVGAYLLGLVPEAKGLALGALFSVINFMAMGQVLPLQLACGTNRRKATLVALGSMAVRMILLCIPLVVGWKSEMFSFWAVVVGLFAVPIGILCGNVVAALAGKRRGALG